MMTQVRIHAFNLLHISVIFHQLFVITMGMTLTEQHATVGQFPYMIYLTILKTQDNSFSCGGSILTQNFGLTAAHCLTFEQENKTLMADSAHAFMGTVDLLGPEDFEIYRKVSEMIIHEKYQIFGNDDFTFHDIALVRFESPLEFCSRVQPISLPRVPYKTFFREIVVGMGWGMTNSGETSTDLLYATSKVISNVRCQKKYNKSTRISYDVTEGMLCVVPAGDNPRGGACMGDSGGPLVLKNSTIIVGIASWTEIKDNCTKDFPDVFTRVTYYLDWITEKTGENEKWHTFGTNITEECPKTEVQESNEVSQAPPQEMNSNSISSINEISILS